MGIHPGGVSRRAFLGGALATGAGLLAACGMDRDDRADDPAADAGRPSRTPDPVSFFGEHQAGILTPAPTAAVMAALDVTAGSATALAEGLRALSGAVQAITTGDDPSGEAHVIVSVGASLFDERFGLADRRPRELVAMPAFPNDRLDPVGTHGDVLLTVSGVDASVTAGTLDRVVDATAGSMVPRWTLAGGNRRAPGEEHPRNLMGFVDGSSNPDSTQEAPMRQFVWVRPRDDEPDWAVGGSYHVVRVIRIDLDVWEDRDVATQEAIVGRRKDSGAPLTGGDVGDVPVYADDPDGEVTPLDAHIRLANPRDSEIEYDSILRRGFSYARGSGPDGRDDAGLAFVAFQRSLDKGFLAIQSRLDGEPMERFVVPEGGGFFFALPGALDASDWLGRSLLEPA